MEVRKKTTEAVFFKEKRIRWFGLLVQIETPLKAINTSASVYQLLFAGKIGVALGANLDSDLVLCGTCHKFVAAVAFYLYLLILRMDSFSHFFHLILCLLINNPRYL